MTGCYVNWFVVKQQTRDGAVAWRGPKENGIYNYACYMYIVLIYFLTSLDMLKLVNQS